MFSNALYSVFCFCFCFFALMRRSSLSGCPPSPVKVPCGFWTWHTERSIPLSKYGVAEVESADATHRAAVALNGSRKQGLPLTSWVFLFMCHSGRMCLIWAYVSFNPPPPLPLPLSFSPSWGSSALGGMGENAARGTVLLADSTVSHKPEHRLVFIPARKKNGYL